MVFEENDPSTGGVFVASISAGSSAEADGALAVGDQLAAVNGEVTTRPFTRPVRTPKKKLGGEKSRAQEARRFAAGL